MADCTAYFHGIIPGLMVDVPLCDENGDPINPVTFPIQLFETGVTYNNWTDLIDGINSYLPEYQTASQNGNEVQIRYTKGQPPKCIPVIGNIVQRCDFQVEVTSAFWLQHLLDDSGNLVPINGSNVGTMYRINFPTDVTQLETNINQFLANNGGGTATVTVDTSNGTWRIAILGSTYPWGSACRWRNVCFPFTKSNCQ